MNMVRHLSRGITAMVLLCTCMTVAAVNLGFMRNSPISKFDDQDLEIFQKAVINALDSAQDGQVISWKSPDSGFNGQIFLLSTSESGNQVCRRMRLVNVAGKLNSNAHYTACRDNVAGWQIVPAQDPQPTTTEE